MYMHQACASDGQRRGSDPQELQLWIVQSYYVGVGNLTSVLYKCSWCSYVLNHQSKPILPFKPGLSPAWQTPSKLSCLTTESQGSAISVSSALGSVPSFLTFGYMDSEGRSQSPLFARQALYKNWAVSLAPGHLLIIKKKKKPLSTNKRPLFLKLKKGLRTKVGCCEMLTFIYIILPWSGEHSRGTVHQQKRCFKLWITRLSI